jgi:glucosyltransferase Lgt1/2/3
MPNPGPTYFKYNPHRHVKIWLSNKPDIFMNTENQMRLISMRERNRKDEIHLIYDSSLLSKTGLINLEDFCNEHRITPVDANTFPKSHQMSENEKKLYASYKDEITHLNEGGNLAVASDILRWLSPVYNLGTYTDFDFPVDTTQLPEKITTKAPLLLNIGSLRTGSVDVILSNNDYIAIVDPQAAKKDIEKIQAGIIKVLNCYETDFIEKTEAAFVQGSLLNKYFIEIMKDRSESIYIARSKSIFPSDKPMTSRETRKYINEMMTNQEKFIQFSQKDQTESRDSVIKRLRTELRDQLTFSKWMFFRNEYHEIKNILAQNDDKLLNYLMKKERTLYLKSIVICTTGPIAIAKFLFNDYVFDSTSFDEEIEPYSFNYYGLNRAFQSKNSIGLHENIFGMIHFLGTEDGKLNDSSWLETGAQLQKQRGERLDKHKERFREKLPSILEKAKNDIQDHIKELEINSTGFWGLFFKGFKKEKLHFLREILSCFEKDSFDTKKFSEVVNNIQSTSHVLYSNYFSNQTQNLIETLTEHCHKAIILGLTKDRKLALYKKTPAYQVKPATETTTAEETRSYTTPGLSIFSQRKESSAENMSNEVSLLPRS